MIPKTEGEQSGKAEFNPDRGGSGWSRPRFYPILILLLGLLVYANTLVAPFTFDDDYYITENPAVTDFRYFLDPSRMEQGIASKQLDQNFRSRRVAVLSFAVNYRLDGFRPVGYHVVNLVLHLINGLLIYWLVLLTLSTPSLAADPEDKRRSCLGYRAALLVALFFVAHPVQTEAVSYVSQRFTSMATMFYLLALDLFISWRLASGRLRGGEASASSGSGFMPRPVLYGLALLATFLAMFTKEIAFTLPLMIVLYDGMFFGWPAGRRGWAWLPFLLTLLIIPATIMGSGARYVDLERLTGALAKPLAANPALTYLFTQFRVIVTYLRLMFLPFAQNVDYDYPSYPGFFQPPVLISLVFLALLAGLGVYLYHRAVRHPGGSGRWQRLISFGIGWFFLTLSVESLLPLKDLLFEHRLYLPSVGFFLALLGVIELARGRFPWLRNSGALWLLLTVLLAMSAGAYARNNLWRDPIALWEDAVRKSPEKWRPHINLGKVFVMAGRLPEAEREFRLALRIDASRAMGHLNLGALYIGLGKIDLALESLERAARLDSSDPVIFKTIGMALAVRGDYEAAARALQKSLQINPGDAETKRKLELLQSLQEPGAG